jgi:tellurite resistance protein TerC
MLSNILNNFFQLYSDPAHLIQYGGVLGALVMRAVFIFAGVSLIDKFHWIIYVFGIFLIFTGIKIVRDKGTKINIAKILSFCL